MLRLASAPLFLVLFFGDFYPEDADWLRFVLCLVLAITSEITDGLDGYLARKWDQVSDFGKLMDPYADSAFRLTALFSFAGSDHRWVALWMVVVLLYRDILTSVVRTFAMKFGVVVAARLSGKLKAVSQAAAIISILTIAAMQQLCARYESFAGVFKYIDVQGGTQWTVARSATWIMWVVMAMAVWSGLDYVWACRRHIMAAAESGESTEKS